MKKISLICSVVLAGLSLGGCGNGHHYNLNKLRAEHSKLLKQTKKKDHKHNKKHSTKSKKTTQQSTSNKNSSSNNKDKTSNQNKQQNNNSQQASQDEYKGMHLSPEEQANVNKGLYPNGTRRPESFANMDDYKRYNAWYQGNNYDPSTNTYTPMNQQQLDNMRQQMNKDGGQSFQ